MLDTKKIDKTSYSVPPVERAFNLLQYIGNGNKCQNLSKASKILKINRTTLIRLIYTLRDNKMIEQIGEHEGYRLGIGLIGLASKAINSRDIIKISQPILHTLSVETNLSVHLGIMDGVDIIYLYKEAPNSLLASNINVGSRLPAHSTSIGRAILAELTDAQVNEIFSQQTIQMPTNKTPTSIEKIIQQKHQDYETGYAWSRGNYEVGIGSCGAAIFNHSNEVISGINVTGRQELFNLKNKKNADFIIDSVVRAAKDISITLGCSLEKHTPAD